MITTILYAVVSVIIVSLVSLIGVVTLLLKKDTVNKLLLTLVSLSAGTLLGGAFLHLLPQSVKESGFTVSVSLLVLAGVLVFFLVEKIIHLHHCHVPDQHENLLVSESHKYHLGLMNLLADGLHNFIDGLVIAGAYLVSIPLGIAATLAVIFHEVPQEIADFGVLLYSGYSTSKALWFNFLSAAVAIVGVVVGLVLGSRVESFAMLMLPFAAGGFIYIAGSNLIPELHKGCDVKESVFHFLALLAGIGIMVLLLLVE